MRHRATHSIALYRLLQMKREKVTGMPAIFSRFISGVTPWLKLSGDYAQMLKSAGRRELDTRLRGCDSAQGELFN